MANREIRKFQGRRTLFATFAAIAVAIGLVGQSIPASAAPPAVSLTAPLTVQPGETLDLIAGMPVSGAGTVDQEIVQTIDPAKVKLTSVAAITAPSGWTLSYCSGASTDCTIGANFSSTTPANASAWAAVKAVKATGSIDSQGESAGRQVAQASVSGGSVSQTPLTLPASAVGLDGFKVFFDAERTRVFNVYHHSGSGNNNFDCYVILTGARCVGFPYKFGSTTGEASLGVVVGSTAWIGGTDGLHCVDLTAVLANTTNAVGGGSPAKCFSGGSSGLLSLKAGSRFDWFTGASTLGQSTETKIYALDTTSAAAMVYCIDTATRASCSAPTIDPNLVGAGSQSVDGSNIYQWGDLLFVSVATMLTTPYQDRVTCVQISNGTKCPGFSSDDSYSSATPQFGKFVPIPATDGSVRAVCYYRVDTTHKCWEADGTQRTAAYYNFPNFNIANSVGTYAYGVPTQIGSRVYYGNARWQDPTPNYTKAEVICYDAAAFDGAGGRCNDGIANLTSSTTKNYVNYTVTPDPEIDNCLWITQHSNPVFKTVNILTGELGCSGIAPSRVTFSGATSVPRMGCSMSSAIAEWASFTLDSPSTGFTSAKLSVRNEDGENIAGWTDVELTAGEALDLSTLPVATTGQAPNFVVNFLGASGSLSASAQIRVIGDAPQLCLRPVAELVCPSGTGPLANLAGSSTTVDATGSANDSLSNVTTMSPASASVSISAPAGSECGATLTGRAGDASLGAAGAAISGVMVSLLNSSGAAVLVGGTPVTTTTDALGNYSFGYLYPGSYKVGFATSDSKTVSSATVVSGASGTSTGTTAASSGLATSNLTVVAVGTNAVVNGLYSLVLSAANDFSTGGQGVAQTISVLANDAASSGRTLTASAVKLCNVSEVSPNCTLGSASAGRVVEGQGKYTVNSSGEVTFTPCSGANTPVMTPACLSAFTGVATGVIYQVTDGASTASATITPTVIPLPTVNADAQTGGFDVDQTYTPASNDTAGLGTTLDVTSVRLCSTNATAPFTSANCSATSVTTADGVYSLDTTTGTVTFDPSNSFSGVATGPVNYVVADALGQYSSSTITPTVTPPSPSTASPNTTTGVVGVAQSVNLLTNDTTPSGVTFTASSARLCAPGTSAPNCVSTTVDVPNVGTYTVSGGTVTFTPCTSAVTANCTTGTAFTGTPTALGYQVPDSLSRVVNSTYTPTVVPPPTASGDGSQGVKGQPQIIALITNDVPGDGVAPLDPTTIRLCDSSETAPNCTRQSLTISGEGTYTINPSGTVTFTPNPDFVGSSTPQRYVVADVLGQVTDATIQPIVVPPPAPITADDSETGPADTPMTIDPLVNDSAGTLPAGLSGDVNLVRSSLRLCDRTELAPNCTATQLTTADGSYTVDTATGFVTFTPRQGFSGVVTQPVTYQIANDWTGPSGIGIATAVIALIIDPAAPPVVPPTLPLAETTSVGLPATGADSVVLALWGVVILGLGGLLMMIGLRSRQEW